MGRGCSRTVSSFSARGRLDERRSGVGDVAPTRLACSLSERVVKVGVVVVVVVGMLSV